MMWIVFLVGLLIGATVGLMTCALLLMASDCDD